MRSGISTKKRSPDPAAASAATTAEPQQRSRINLRKLFGGRSAAVTAPDDGGEVVRQFNLSKTSREESHNSGGGDENTEGTAIKSLGNPFCDDVGDGMVVTKGGLATGGVQAPQTTTTLLMNEASTKARMLRAASGMVDVEYTAATCLKGNASFTQRASVASLPDHIPDSHGLHLAADGNTQKLHPAAGSGLTSSPPLSLAPACGSSTTPSKTSLHRMCSTVACPGFQDKGAETELRQALQLRKLKTKQLN